MWLIPETKSSKSCYCHNLLASELMIFLPSTVEYNFRKSVCLRVYLESTIIYTNYEPSSSALTIKA